MNSKFVFGLVAIAAAITVQASTPVSLSKLRKATPISFARIFPDGHRGPWMPYIQQDFSPNNIVYDAYEANPTGTGAPDQFRTPVFTGNGFQAGTRVYFGPTYKTAHWADDITLTKGYAGGTSTRCNHVWFNNVAERFYMAIGTYETFDPTGPTVTTPLGGWIFDFGTLAAGGWYTGLTLTGTNVWNNPADGKGAVDVSYYKVAPDNTGHNYTYSTTAQPFIWMIKPSAPKAGSSSNLFMDDRNLSGGFNAGELYNYNLGNYPSDNTTPLPYQGCIAFYASYAVELDLPTAVTTTLGSYFSGNLASLSADDTNKYCAFDDDGSFETNILISSVTNIGLPGGMHVIGTTNVSRVGLTQEVLVHNFNSGDDDIVDSREASLSDDSFEVDVVTGANNGSVAQDYVSGTGAMQANIHTYPFNDETPGQDGWLTCINSFCFAVR